MFHSKTLKNPTVEFNYFRRVEFNYLSVVIFLFSGNFNKFGNVSKPY